MNGQQLKNSILQWAIQGKLVPQDPKEGTAEDLLKAIRADKEQLVKAGKLKKKDLVTSNIYKDADGKWYETVGKETTEITEDIPFEIPDGWSFVRLKYLCSRFQTGPFGTMLHKSDYVEIGGIPMVNPTNIEKCVINNINIKYVRVSKVDELSSYVLNEGDYVIARRGDLGKIALVSREQNGWIAGTGSFFMNVLEIDKDYFIKIYNSPYVQKSLMKGSVGTTMPNLNQTLLGNLLFPLPPLSEQRRIVAKIEELMPLVEKYGKSQEKLDKLNEVIYSQLEKSILQEAIQGKLVPQLAGEGTAEQLLADIRAEKERLVKEGKLSKKDLVTSNIYKEDDKWFETTGKETKDITDEIPFDVPEGWKWCRLKTLSKLITKGTTPRGGNVAYTENGIGFLRAENVKGYLDLDISNLKYVGEQEHLRFLSRSILKENDILITIAGTLGRTAIVKKLDLPLNTNQAISIVRLVNCNMLNLKFLVFSLNAPFIQKTFMNQKKMTAIPNLTLEIINDTFVPLPPLAEQHRIVEKIEEFFGELDKIKELAE